MADRAATGNTQVPGVKFLNRLFAGVLMDAKMNSCWAAWESVKATKNPHKKKELLTEQFAKWREESAKAIRSYYPQYVDLAKAYPELVSIDPVEWAEDSVWDLLISAYGVKRFSDPAP